MIVTTSGACRGQGEKMIGVIKLEDVFQY